MAIHSEKSLIEGIMVDAELFLKYRMPTRAIAMLAEAITRFPGNAELRWRLAEYCADINQMEEAANHLIALADIYINAQELELANSALMRAKLLFPSSSQITNRLTLINQAQLKPEPQHEPQYQVPLAGDLRYISLFDIIQVLEKNRITGIITVFGEQLIGTLYFNHGLLADAIFGSLRGKTAFKCFAEITEGFFELERSPVEFQPSIITESNAQLILEIFSDSDDESG